MYRKNIIFRILSLILIIGFLLFWEFSTHESYLEGGEIPPFSSVFQTFIELLYNGVIQESILDSLIRFVLGLAIGSTLGIILGLLLGRFIPLEITLEPFIQFFRPISPIAWLPIIVLWFGIGEIGAIFIIAYAVFFPLLLLSISGVRQIQPTLLMMANNFGASEWITFKHIILPGAFVSIASGLKLAASIAWIHLVAAEMLGIQSGLGYLIIDGRNLLRIDIVLVAMILIGFLGFLIHYLFSILERYIRSKLGSL
ncbi:ABC transporter permease [Helicobacter apodemus]|uniref:Taurine ABC transporter permease n=1 Tax=Helicobacter apodemus TaxID=135569 RepID=A0A2U8FB10_9HELI|nr:ABC transporter permease [Helicobacter apodemus]AWI33431.1 taurine ABC transporter permease [Helicobacter apodemus]